MSATVSIGLRNYPQRPAQFHLCRESTLLTHKEPFDREVRWLTQLATEENHHEKLGNDLNGKRDRYCSHAL